MSHRASVRVRFLILEDGPPRRADLEAALREVAPGATVEIAQTVAEARRAAAKGSADAVFLDLTPPSTRAGLAFIWDLARRGDARIVTVGGPGTDPRLVEAASAMGARAHVEEPIDPASIRAALGLGPKPPEPL